MGVGLGSNPGVSAKIFRRVEESGLSRAVWGGHHITKFLSEVTEDFEVLGEKDEDWFPFKKMLNMTDLS